jgi:hypothetical protein
LYRTDAEAGTHAKRYVSVFHLSPPVIDVVIVAITTKVVVNVVRLVQVRMMKRKGEKEIRAQHEDVKKLCELVTNETLITMFCHHHHHHHPTTTTLPLTDITPPTP